MITPQNWSELKTELQNRRAKYGVGTESKPIDLNDIDVSNVDNMNMLFTGRTIQLHRHIRMGHVKCNKYYGYVRGLQAVNVAG